MRRDRDYWARLRKDARSNAATGLAIVAAIVAVVALQPSLFPGAPTRVRLDPLYWLLLLPIAWWGAGLAAFEPGPVRLMRTVTIAAPPIAAGATLLAWFRGADWAIPFALAAISFGTAIVSRLLYRGSLLEREGPAR